MANSLNKINSGGIKDDSIVNADIKSDAAIALSKLASTPAVLTGSTNNQITTVTGANAIQGEANLIFDGSNLGVNCTPSSELHVKGSNEILRLETTGTTGGNYINFNDADENKAFIGLGSGSDDSLSMWLVKSSNLRFATGDTERVRIESDGDCLFLGGTLRIKDSGNSAQRGAIYGDASSFHVNAGVNNLILYSAGNEAVRIDSGKRLGINKTPAAYHSNNKGVIAGDGGYAMFGRGTDTLIISQNHYYDGSDVGKYIADGAGSFYQQENGMHKFWTAGSGSADGNISLSEKLRVQNGGGISFNGDSAAANALDDYEEGTWDAALQNGALHGSYNKLSYTKIGRVVHVSGQIRLNGGSTDVGISNLPFTVASHSEGENYVAMPVYSYQNDFPSCDYLIGYANPGTTIMDIRGIRDNNTAVAVTGSDNGYFMIGGSYWAA